MTKKMTGEDHFLDIIDRHFGQDRLSGTAREHLVLGRGDDCALLKCPDSDEDGSICLSTDLFLEDAHFRRRYFSPGDIGHKGLAVNLSDIAGMGAEPLGFSLGLMCPKEFDEAFWDELFQGMAELAGRAGVPLTGGDLSGAAKLGMSVTVWGRRTVGGRFVRRAQCSPGDLIFVVGRTDVSGGLLGALGLARAGLLALEEKGRCAVKLYPEATRQHLRPVPMLDAGRLLGAAQGVSSLMDLSDGPARDIPRLVGPGLGAELTIDSGELNPELHDFARETGADAVETAVLGGEDYGLLGTMKENAAERLLRDIPGLAVIGQVTETQTLRVNGLPFTRSGFDHFG